MACNKKLTQDILFDCTSVGKAGIDGGKAVLINVADIDLTASTLDSAKITNLQLNAGSTGYSLEWYKQLANASSAYAPNTEAVDGFTHSFVGRMSTSSTDSAERANELKNGSFIVVIETKYKGTDNAEAFKVYGFSNGLELSELTNSTAENGGNLLFTLSTKEGDYEQYPYQILLDTDYATTSSAFASLFIEA